MSDTTVGVNFVAQTQDALAGISSLEAGLMRLASMGRMLGVIGAGIFIGTKIAGAFKAVLNNGETAEMQISRLTSAFTELSGKTGIPAAKLAMDEYQKAVAFAAKTPFDVKSVIDSAVAMRSQGVDPLTESYKNLAGKSVSLLDIMGNTAANAQDFQENMLAFTSASQGMMGVTVLARRLNMPIADLQKGLNGLTPSTQAWRDQLLKNIALVPRFQNGMDLASKTLTGIKSNIEDMGDQFVTAMADIQNSAGIYGKVKAALASFGNWLAENGDKLKFFAKVIGLYMGQLFDFVMTILSPIGAVFKHIGNWIVGFQDKMTAAVNGMSSKVDTVGEKARALATFSERLSLYVSLTFGSIRLKIQEFYGVVSKVMDFLGIDAMDVFLAMIAIMGGKFVFAAAKAIWSMVSLQGALATLSKVGIVILVAEIISLVRNWDNLSAVSKVARIVLIGLTAAFVALSYGLGPVIVATWAFTAALLANPITWIVLGIVALIAGIVMLVKNWDTVVAVMKKVWVAIGGFFDKIKPKFSAFVGYLESFGKMVWDIWSWPFRKVWELIVWVFDGISGSIGGVVDTIAAFGTKVIELLVYPFKAAYLQIKQALGAVWDFLFGESQEKEIKVSGTVTTKSDGTPRTGRAGGGSVYAGKAYRVGEDGPETFIPSIAGMIVPNSKGSVVSQAFNVSLNIDARGATDPQAIAKAIDNKLKATLPEMVRNWSFSAV